MFKRKKDNTIEEIKDTKIEKNDDELIEKSIEKSETKDETKDINMEENIDNVISDDNESDDKKIDYKKELIKIVTVKGNLNKAQTLVVKTYLKKTTEEEQKDMYEKIQKEGLNVILDKFKSANIIKTVVK